MAQVEATQHPTVASPSTDLQVLVTDQTMKVLVCSYGVLSQKNVAPFAALGRSIISQQISTKAANTIRKRLEVTLGLTPEGVSSVPVDILRQTGLSRTKAASLQSLAQFALDGGLNKLALLSDDEVVQRLVAIKGIGRWTADMFLIFGLWRPDIWPVSDAGLRSAVARSYGITARAEITELGLRFVPFRSLAARYLWRSLEND